MSATVRRSSSLAAALLLAACASPPRTTELAKIDQFAGYRYVALEHNAPKSIDKSAIILTFSGGGTRAAALSDGVLRALAETQVPGATGMVPLASQVDLVSSVSGGSVTAAYFAMGGVEGLDAFEKDFLNSDIMGTLIERTLFNPLQLFKPRIDILESYLDEEVFHHKTFADLMSAGGSGKERRPYIVLNAADMASGSVFSFNQDQFDLICADLTKLKLSSAVASSAAFPVALSAVTLKNYAPCAAQNTAATSEGSGWLLYDGAPEPLRIANDRTADTVVGVDYPAAVNLSRFRRGTVALGFLNRGHKADNIQLLDGGIADNLGLTLPFTLLTSPSEAPSFYNWVNSVPQRADKLLLLVVNARSEADNDFGERTRPPGTFDTLLTTIGTPIDANSFQLVGKLDRLIDDRFRPRSVVVVDFDFISEPACRRYFHNMATSWTLPGDQVGDLIALGKAMVLQSPYYQTFVKALNGTAPAPNPSVEQLCADHRASS